LRRRWGAQTVGHAGLADAALLVRAFLADCAEPGDASPFVRVALVPSILRHATRLVALHPLRAYDAVQLASALAVEQALGEPLTFAAADRALNSAAAAEGLVLATLV
jgi:predicted nucleic acid-binding protein